MSVDVAHELGGAIVRAVVDDDDLQSRREARTRSITRRIVPSSL